MKKKIFNPFLPLDEYIADPEAHVFGDRVYLFGSHDKEGGTTYCEEGNYIVYSASINDLSDWKYEGIIYMVEQDPLASKKDNVYLYAPDVVQGNDGRFYLYYCLSGFYNYIGVAVSDSPAGKYEYYGFVRNQDVTPFRRGIPADPAVINDNGIIRLYYGWSLSSKSALAHGHEIDIKEVKRKIFTDENFIQAQMRLFNKSKDEIISEPGGIMGAFTVVLDNDMLTVTSDPVRIVPGEFSADNTSFEGHAFYEASSIRKVANLYYFIYSSQLSHELCYAVSKYPDKDFIYGGTIISNGDVGYNGRKEEDRLNMTANNHGCIEYINGKWYIFYHRHTHRSTFSRQVCAEPITILPDGSIPQVEMKSCGLNNGAFLAEGEYPAVIACNLTNGKMPHITNRKIDDDIPFITHNGCERYITNIKEGTMIGYKYFIFNSPVTLKVVTRGNGIGNFTISTGARDIGTIKILPSDKWETYSTSININGFSALYFIYHGSGTVEFLSFKLESVKY